MQLYSNNLSAIAIIFSSIKLDFFPACLLSYYYFNLSQSLLRSDGKNLVFEKEFFETAEALAFTPGNLCSLISDLSRRLLIPGALLSKCVSFAKSYYKILSDKIAKSTL